MYRLKFCRCWRPALQQLGFKWQVYVYVWCLIFWTDLIYNYDESITLVLRPASRLTNGVTLVLKFLSHLQQLLTTVNFKWRWLLHTFVHVNAFKHVEKDWVGQCNSILCMHQPNSFDIHKSPIRGGSRMLWTMYAGYATVRSGSKSDAKWLWGRSDSQCWWQDECGPVDYRTEPSIAVTKNWWTDFRCRRGSAEEKSADILKTSSYLQVSNCCEQIVHVTSRFGSKGKATST